MISTIKKGKEWLHKDIENQKGLENIFKKHSDIGLKLYGLLNNTEDKKENG